VGSDLLPKLGFLIAAAFLHKESLKNIFRQPMEFFDVTPIGRILGRFSKDVDVIDTLLPRVLDSMVFFSFQVFVHYLFWVLGVWFGPL
jgi:ATP-binding cassette subfamily C (CFTR/MRP) protein 1